VRWMPPSLLLAGALIFSGCGSSEDGQESSATPAEPVVVTASVRASAGSLAEREAAKASKAVKDRYLQGPRKYRAQCPRSKVKGPNSNDIYTLTCTVTLFLRPQAIYKSSSAPFSLNVVDEEWVVRVDETGRVVDAAIGQDGYAIGGFLEADDQFNCSGGESLNC